MYGVHKPEMPVYFSVLPCGVCLAGRGSRAARDVLKLQGEVQKLRDGVRGTASAATKLAQSGGQHDRTPPAVRPALKAAAAAAEVAQWRQGGCGGGGAGGSCACSARGDCG